MGLGHRAAEHLEPMAWIEPGSQEANPPGDQDIPQTLSVVTTANADVASNALSVPPNAVIVSVTPQALDVSHGRIYARVGLYLAGDLSRLKSTLWAGYLTSGVPASFPNLKVSKAYRVRLIVTATANGGGVTVQFDIGWRYGPVLPYGPVIFYEPPGSGVGDLRIVNLGDPAIGVQYSDFVVPARTQLRTRSLNGALTAHGGGTTLLPEVVYLDGSGNVYGRGMPASSIAIGDVVTFFGAIDQTAVGEIFGNRVQLSLPDVLAVPNHVVRVVMNALAGTDNLGPAFLEVEEWAGPFLGGVSIP